MQYCHNARRGKDTDQTTVAMIQSLLKEKNPPEPVIVQKKLPKETGSTLSRKEKPNQPTLNISTMYITITPQKLGGAYSQTLRIL